MFPYWLVQIVVVLLVVGVLLWALTQITFIDPAMKQVIKVVIIVITAIWLIYVLAGALQGGDSGLHSHWHLFRD